MTVRPFIGVRVLMRLLENGEIPTVLQIKRCNDNFRDLKGLKELINFVLT